MPDTLPLGSLDELYRYALADLHGASLLARPALTMLAEAAQDPDLRAVLEDSLSVLERDLGRSAQLAERHDMRLGEVHSAGMATLAGEAMRMASLPFPDAGVRDAVLIAMVQRLAHYAIACYSTLRAYAERLGLAEDAAVLDDGLSDIYDLVDHLTDLATGGSGASDPDPDGDCVEGEEEPEAAGL